VEFLGTKVSKLSFRGGMRMTFAGGREGNWDMKCLGEGGEGKLGGHANNSWTTQGRRARVIEGESSIKKLRGEAVCIQTGERKR